MPSRLWSGPKSKSWSGLSSVSEEEESSRKKDSGAWEINLESVMEIETRERKRCAEKRTETNVV